MKIEELKQLGIEDEELIKQIFALHGKTVEKIKSDFSTTQTERDQFKQQLEEATKTIEGFKDLDIDGIKKAADDWKIKAEQTELEANEKIKALQFDHALETKLRDAKAKNPKTVKALLDSTALIINDAGEIEGLDDQLESIREENDYLFDSDEEIPQIITGGNNRRITPDAVAGAARKSAGLDPNYDD